MQAVDTFYWQKDKKQQADMEQSDTGWAPSPFRRHAREEETQVFAH